MEAFWLHICFSQSLDRQVPYLVVPGTQSTLHAHCTNIAVVCLCNLTACSHSCVKTAANHFPSTANCSDELCRLPYVRCLGLQLATHIFPCCKTTWTQCHQQMLFLYGRLRTMSRALLDHSPLPQLLTGKSPAHTTLLACIDPARQWLQLVHAKSSYQALFLESHALGS